MIVCILLPTLFFISCFAVYFIFPSNHVGCSFISNGWFSGNEEVKLAILSAVASWAARSADSVQLDLVSFIAAGLKEKEVLRRGHLRCLQVICKNADAVLQVTLVNYCHPSPRWCFHHVNETYWCCISDIIFVWTTCSTCKNWFHQSSAAIGWGICFACCWEDSFYRYQNRFS